MNLLAQGLAQKSIPTGFVLSTTHVNSRFCDSSCPCGWCWGRLLCPRCQSALHLKQSEVSLNSQNQRALACPFPKKRLLLGEQLLQKKSDVFSLSGPAVLIRKTARVNAWLFLSKLSKKLFRSAPRVDVKVSSLAKTCEAYAGGAASSNTCLHTQRGSFGASCSLPQLQKAWRTAACTWTTSPTCCSHLSPDPTNMCRAESTGLAGSLGSVREQARWDRVHLDPWQPGITGVVPQPRALP